MGRNEFENNVYIAQNSGNEPRYPDYAPNSVSDPALDPYQPVEVEEVNSSQVIVANSDAGSSATQQLNPLRRHFILEPPIFLIYFAQSLASVVFTNQLLYQSCKVIFGYAEAECQPMLGITNANTNSQIEKQVQPYVSRIILANSLISSIMPAILALFIGAWSDRFGRRPVLIISLIGMCVGYFIGFILAMVSANSPTNPWLYVIAQIPAAVTGSTCAFSIVCYCYIADVAPPQLKALKMVLNDAADGAGSVIGTLAGSALFAKTSMQVVFAVSTLALLVATLYVYFVNEESLKVEHTSLGHKLCQFFSLSHVVELVRTCAAKRANHMRTFIWLTMIALVITNFTTAGESNVFYLFVRAKFNATVSQYSDYNSISDAIQIVGGIIAIVAFRKYLQFSFVTMAMLTLLSAVFESTVRAAAQQFWQMYLGTALGFMSGIITPMLLTILAFVTPTNETGKVFSVTTSLSTITPLGASPLYTSVYDATLSYYPGMFNIISAVLYFISFVLVFVVFFVSKRKEITVSPPIPARLEMVSFEMKTPPAQDKSSIQHTSQDVENLIAEKPAEGPAPFSPNNAMQETDSEDLSNKTVSTISQKRTIVEPAVFLIYVATTIASAVLQNQLLFQTCVAVYDYDEQVCEPLLGVKSKNDEAIVIETKVQPYVARIIMVNSLINSILPALLCLFIGAWSDKFGRRPILIATFSAALLGHIIMAFLAGISVATPINPWVYIISSIPLAVTGGTCALITMVFCLVSDVSDEVGKARRMFLVDGALGIGTLAGNLISSYILSATGTIGVFGIAAGLDLVALLYLLIFVGESVKLKHERKESKVREFFKFDLIKDLVKSCVRRRPHFDRGVIWCIIFTLVSTTFVTQGETNVFYLFLRNKFNVTLQDFTTFNAAAIVIKMVGCAIVLVLLRVLFKVPITVVSMLGLAGCFLDSATRALAQQFWEMYLAALMGFMGGINSPMLQAVLAGLVDATEIGKIYAVISSLQTLSPLLSAPVYTGIYNASLETYPGAFFVLSSGIYLICFLLITGMIIMQRYGARADRSQSAAAVQI
ncbi:uncharacterized protein LOC128868765 [Anastrepha ludens]|uniref:uncharacterized protein LOC128868765 n=1 Tax=Anastrepha ludens TaxID=28586 RepID=UPI0023AF5139|nr:uncharacterized protein LOC128868765 [Anastrepha ludens]